MDLKYSALFIFFRKIRSFFLWVSFYVGFFFVLRPIFRPIWNTGRHCGKNGCPTADGGDGWGSGGGGKENYLTQSICRYVVFASCVTHSLMSSESFHQQICSSSSAILLLYTPQRVWAGGLTLISILLTLAEA
jgi:hypothetical protein